MVNKRLRFAIFSSALVPIVRPNARLRFAISDRALLPENQQKTIRFAVTSAALIDDSRRKRLRFAVFENAIVPDVNVQKTIRFVITSAALPNLANPAMTTIGLRAILDNLTREEWTTILHFDELPRRFFSELAASETDTTGQTVLAGTPRGFTKTTHTVEIGHRIENNPLTAERMEQIVAIDMERRTANQLAFLANVLLDIDQEDGQTDLTSENIQDHFRLVPNRIKKYPDRTGTTVLRFRYEVWASGDLVEIHRDPNTAVDSILSFLDWFTWFRYQTRKAVTRGYKLGR